MSVSPDVAAILEQRLDPASAVDALVRHLLGDSAVAPSDLPGAFRSAHALLASAGAERRQASASEILSALCALPDSESRRVHLLLSLVCGPAPELVDGLLREVASRRASSPADALAFAELARLAAALLPDDDTSRHLALVRVHLTLANLHRLLGRYGSAQADLRRARRWLDVAPDARLDFRCESFAASLALDRRRLSSALAHLERAETLARALDCGSSLARVLIQRAAVESHDQHLQSAHALLLEAQDLLDPEDDPGLFLCVLHNRTLLLLDLGAAAEALALYRSAAPLYRAASTPQMELRHLWLLGRFALLDGDLGLATERLEGAHRRADELGQVFDRALLELEIGLVQLHRGRACDAALYAHQALSALGLLDLPREAAAALLVLMTSLRRHPSALTPEPFDRLLRCLRHTVPIPAALRPAAA